jgi:hypothetical protein
MEPQSISGIPIATGTVVDGKIVLEGVSLPEGMAVTVLAVEPSPTIRVSPALQAELEEALADADREPGISAPELFEQLQKYRAP